MSKKEIPNIIEFKDEVDDIENLDSGNESIYTDNFNSYKDLDSRLLNQLENLGFVKMTRTQKIVIPKVLTEKDILIRAPTGTGKTLSFLVPAIQLSLLRDNSNSIKRSDGTYILIIAPTRELCIQTMETAQKLMQKVPWCVVGSICGGEKRKSEKARLRKGITILGSTPGRLLDHIESTSCFNTVNLKTLILDEADRLLEEGFGSTFKRIYLHIMNNNSNFSECQQLNTKKSKIDNEIKDDSSMLLNIKHDKLKEFNNNEANKKISRQVILISATLSKPVEDLARYCLKNDPQWVILDQYREIKYENQLNEYPSDSNQSNKIFNSNVKGIFSVPINLSQECVIIQDKYRIPALISLLLLRTIKKQRIVVFVSSTQVVEYYYAILQSIRWPSDILIKGGPKIKKFIQILENSKIENQNNGVNCKNKFGNLKYVVNKGRLFNKKRWRKNDTNISDNSSDNSNESYNDSLKYTGSLDDNLNLTSKSRNKWLTTNTRLKELYESMFESYIFHNSIHDDEFNDEKTILDRDNCASIYMLHGHMVKEDRIGQLKSFENNEKSSILITSDVASRGLNFPKIDLVIQFDPPQSIEEYVHRIGRTARMGEKGTGIIFLRPSEKEYIDILKTYGILRDNKDIIILSNTTIWEGFIVSNRNSGKIDDIPGFYYSIINKILTLDPYDTHCELLNKARRAYMAFIRSYCSYDNELSKVFCIKKLHLGHVASSFGINEHPNKIINHIKLLDGVSISRNNKSKLMLTKSKEKRNEIQLNSEISNDSTYKEKVSLEDVSNVKLSHKSRINKPKINRSNLEEKYNKKIKGKPTRDSTLKETNKVETEREPRVNPDHLVTIDKILSIMRSRNEIYNLNMNT
ncbi:DEAD DEAH box helicase family protein [Cryptosporidium andersoni]|uniref:ATP-dependent RNA helicase n=1 Tax=Cryptosporidium andersoni TaxID=117008 RepID=A0A1J4MRD3_9CRYT|nr:DEAD DEAH box helicase family protein [Cryptosporidium andersoni]